MVSSFVFTLSYARSSDIYKRKPQRVALAISYNQPKLSPNASWNPNATTFANRSIVGLNPRGIFIDINDTIYVADSTNNRIQIWLGDSILPVKSIAGNLSEPIAVFYTITGDIYVGDLSSRIHECSSDTSICTSVIYTNSSCFGLFVDISNTIYCSMGSRHLVAKQRLKANTTIWTTVAGNDTAGNSTNMLQFPRRIFVDTNFDLYVADAGNNRIQLFRQGQADGITVAGDASPNLTITLNWPTAVILDADKYLFVTDARNDRIVRSGPYGFRCIAGCSGLNGSASDQFSYPSALSFDSYGNLYVLDHYNHRLQKFSLIRNTSGKCSERTLHRFFGLRQSFQIFDEFQS